MAVVITSEELECRDILNDVGIFFNEEDSDFLGAELTNYDAEFKPITSIVSSPEQPAKSVIPVSPPTTPEVVSASPSKESLSLLAPNPLSIPPLQLPMVLPPVLPALMPNPNITPAVMEAASRIQRAVSDVSMTSTTPKRMKSTTNNSTNSRKRSLQGMLQADVDPDEQIRRKRNREHAKKSRQRKKALTDDLQTTVETLRSETEKLRQELYAKLGEEEVTAILAERKRKEHEDFISALRQPKNRVVDASALKFLKGLSKKLPKHQE
jgi:hypothetical protein